MSRTLAPFQYDTLLSALPSCPITRIEVERKLSPMAQLVRHTNQAPAFI